jgi:hypothetical protein
MLKLTARSLLMLTGAVLVRAAQLAPEGVPDPRLALAGRRLLLASNGLSSALEADRPAEILAWTYEAVDASALTLEAAHAPEDDTVRAAVEEMRAVVRSVATMQFETRVRYRASRCSPHRSTGSLTARAS